MIIETEFYTQSQHTVYFIYIVAISLFLLKSSFLIIGMICLYLMILFFNLQI